MLRRAEFRTLDDEREMRSWAQRDTHAETAPPDTPGTYQCRACGRDCLVGEVHRRCFDLLRVCPHRGGSQHGCDLCSTAEDNLYTD